jgi:cell division septation protein DedD
MKTHTYFLSGKALAIVGGALVTSGALVFIVGVFVGLLIQEPATRVMNGISRDGTPSAPSPIASTQGASAIPLEESHAAWPFGTSATPEPAEASPADTAAPAAAPAAPAAPAKPKADVPPTKRGTVSDVVYIAPDPTPRAAAIKDDAPFTVRVGSFRVERNARMLIARLESSGYKAVESVHVEGDRELHVVTVGGFVGRRAAIFAAEKIGDAAHLVATAVPARAHR